MPETEPLHLSLAGVAVLPDAQFDQQFAHLREVLLETSKHAATEHPPLFAAPPAAVPVFVDGQNRRYTIQPTNGGVQAVPIPAGTALPGYRPVSTFPTAPVPPEPLPAASAPASSSGPYGLDIAPFQPPDAPDIPDPGFWGDRLNDLVQNVSDALGTTLETFGDMAAEENSVLDMASLASMGGLMDFAASLGFEFGFGVLEGMLDSAWGLNDRSSAGAYIAQKLLDKLVIEPLKDKLSEALQDAIKEMITGKKSSSGGGGGGGKKVSRTGDKSDHKGAVIGMANQTLIDGVPAVRKGDMHVCSQSPHPPTPIITGNPTILIEGKRCAGEGHKVECGATITPTPQDVLMGEESDADKSQQSQNQGDGNQPNSDASNQDSQSQPEELHATQDKLDDNTGSTDGPSAEGSDSSTSTSEVSGKVLQGEINETGTGTGTDVPSGGFPSGGLGGASFQLNAVQNKFNLSASQNKFVLSAAKSGPPIKLQWETPIWDPRGGTPPPGTGPVRIGKPITPVNDPFGPGTGKGQFKLHLEQNHIIKKPPPGFEGGLKNNTLLGKEKTKGEPWKDKENHPTLGAGIVWSDNSKTGGPKLSSSVEMDMKEGKADVNLFSAEWKRDFLPKSEDEKKKEEEGEKLFDFSLGKLLKTTVTSKEEKGVVTVSGSVGGTVNIPKGQATAGYKFGAEAALYKKSLETNFVFTDPLTGAKVSYTSTVGAGVGAAEEWGQQWGAGKGSWGFSSGVGTFFSAGGEWHFTPPGAEGAGGE